MARSPGGADGAGPETDPPAYTGTENAQPGEHRHRDARTRGHLDAWPGHTGNARAAPATRAPATPDARATPKRRDTLETLRRTGKPGHAADTHATPDTPAPHRTRCDIPETLRRTGNARAAGTRRAITRARAETHR
ncbi:hypothetical protein GCM10022220_56840 [Actinocatenispora rupis]|uniref:Uncharacterized protein n=1 Tax=Actinocatenispora rupis TaxID=519421 RepID=A0A8J3JGE9_9ACTN|nr:hypothetical protein Aru02nite_52920 [Actinocatenispora rupis]